MKICFVSGFPPSKAVLNEYGFHVARELQADPLISLTILSDEYSGPEPELPEFDVQRCWKENRLSNHTRLLKAIRDCKPDVVWFNLGFASFGSRAIPAFLGVMVPMLSRLRGYYTHVTLHQIMDTMNLEDARVPYPRLYRLGGWVATRMLLLADSISVLIPAYRRTLIERYGGNNVHRWVTSRTADGQTWTFTPSLPSCSANPCTQQVAVITPPHSDGTTAASDTHVYTFTIGTDGTSVWNTQTQYFRGSSNTPFVTKKTDYGLPGACPANTDYAGSGDVPIRDTLIWPNATGSISKKAEYCYDGVANKTVQKEWDYQANGNFAATPDLEIDNVYVTDPNYIGANILRLLKSTTTKDAHGVQVAQTTYGYDETSLQPSNITQNHTTSAGPRGNRTSVSHWLNTNNTSIVSNTAWYDSGEVYQSKDPLGHTGTAYFDSTGAYPNKVCNALNQCSYPVHDFNTGLMASFTDANGSQAGVAGSLPQVGLQVGGLAQRELDRGLELVERHRL